MRKKNAFLLGLPAVLLVMGLVLTSCAQLAGVAIANATQSSQNKRLSSVIEYAISEIEKVLPDNAVVWIQKGRESTGVNRNAMGITASTAGAADTAVDDITSSVVPQGNNQRMQIRVMDIERGVPLMQSGSGEEWRL